jgi:ribosomal protein L40E
MSAVRDCLFSIFAATLHIGGRSSIRNPMTRRAVVTGTYLQHGLLHAEIVQQMLCIIMYSDGPIRAETCRRLCVVILLRF